MYTVTLSNFLVNVKLQKINYEDLQYVSLHCKRGKNFQMLDGAETLTSENLQFKFT